MKQTASISPTRPRDNTNETELEKMLEEQLAELSEGKLAPAAPGNDSEEEQGSDTAEVRKKVFPCVDIERERHSFSSYLKKTTICNKGRLSDNGYWSPDPADEAPYHQLDVGSPLTLGGIAVKGSNTLKYHISKLKLTYSTTGRTWHSVPGEYTVDGESCSGEGNPKPFLIPTPAFRCRYVRVHPLEWKGYACLRVGVLMEERDAWEYERSLGQRVMVAELHEHRKREKGYFTVIEELKKTVAEVEVDLSLQQTQARTREELSSLRERQLLNEVEDLKTQISEHKQARAHLHSLLENTQSHLHLSREELSLKNTLTDIRERNRTPSPSPRRGDPITPSSDVVQLQRKLEEATQHKQMLLRDMRLLRSDLEYAHEEKKKAREDADLYQSLLIKQ